MRQIEGDLGKKRNKPYKNNRDVVSSVVCFGCIKHRRKVGPLVLCGVDKRGGKRQQDRGFNTIESERVLLVLFNGDDLCVSRYFYFSYPFRGVWCCYLF